MTTLEMFKLVRRRWYIYAASILVVIAATFMLSNMPRIYTATAELQFTEPMRLPPAIEGNDQRETLIDFTGAVAIKYDAEYPNTLLSSPTATLFGNGLREGVAVELAATGNQWTTSFVRPVVTIHVASMRAKDALPTIERVAGELESISRGLQSEAGAAETYQIRSSMDLDLVTVNSFGQTRTGRVGGSVVLFVAAMVLSTLVARFLDNFKRWRTGLVQEPPLGISSGLHSPSMIHG